MPAYTLRIRRSDPASGEAAYWDKHTVEHAATQPEGTMSACPPRPPRQRYCSAITKRERPRRDRSAPATRDLQAPRSDHLAGVVCQASHDEQARPVEERK